METEIEFRVPVTKILKVGPHPNADRLDIVTVFDFQVVTQRDKFKENDTCILIPIDSILPNDVEAKLFGPDSKIKLTKGRVRQIRIRKFPSQGMIVSPTELGLKNLEEGENLAGELGITKYEPPAPQFQGTAAKKFRNKIWENNYLHEYGGIQNWKWYPDLFEEGQDVVYQEKIHGTNGRAGLLPYQPKTFWQRVKGWLGLNPEFQFAYGSNKVQLQSKSYTGYYEENIYAKACVQYGIEQKLRPHETVYFEIFGPGIQKGYTYGVKEGEHQIVVFDVKVLAPDKLSTRWLSTVELESWCKERDLPLVPYLYKGPHSKELAKQYTEGASVVGKQPIREGIVIKDPKETVSYIGKKYLKYLSAEYLDLDGTDFH